MSGLGDKNKSVFATLARLASVEIKTVDGQRWVAYMAGVEVEAPGALRSPTAYGETPDEALENLYARLIGVSNQGGHVTTYTQFGKRQHRLTATGWVELP